MGFSPFRNALAALTLSGSILSFFGRHFRHALILNLAIADGINALNNSISGLYLLIRQKDIVAGGPCTINGFIGQMTVQATDFAILAISIVTLLTITRGSIFDDRQSSRMREVLICLACWVVPFTTSFIVLGLRKYGPVSGNWCWVVAQPPFLRYVTTHAWRFAFILAEVIMYTYLHFWLRAHFKNMNQFSSSNNKNFTNSGVSTGVSDASTANYASPANYNINRSAARRPSVSHIAPEEKFSASLEDKSSTRITADDVQRVAYPDGPNVSDSNLGRANSVRVGVHTTVETDIAHTSDQPLPRNANANISTTISSRADNSRPAVPTINNDEVVENYNLPSNPFSHRRADDEDDDVDDDRVELEYGNNFNNHHNNNSIPLSTDISTTSVVNPTPRAPPVAPATTNNNAKQRKFSHGRIQRILLLNAYPAAYILLWIPGLANRIAEASGHPSKVLQIMQASTQFVGFANALTYGWNERISNQVRKQFRKQSPRSGSR